MRKTTQLLLCLYVSTVSWDIVEMPLVGSISRAVGLAAIGFAVLTTMIEGRFRKPNAVIVFAAAFTGWSALSLLWTIAYSDTVTRVFTYTQLLASLWMVREFVRTRKDQEPLLVAFCLGTFLPLGSLLSNFRSNVQISMAGRYSATGLNADTLGLTLVLCLPMAWYLILQRRGPTQIMAMVYFTLAPLALLLTGTRGAFLAGMIALSIVPATLMRRSLRSRILAGVLVIVAVTAAVIVVPQSSWTRILSIHTEITEGGSMTGRKDIWNAGMQVFPQHPFVGVGANAYGAAVLPLLGKAHAPHNMFIGVLVEGGIVGAGVLLALLAACAWTTLRLPPPHRALWSVLMLTWLIGALSANWEYAKITWLLFGLVAAQEVAAPVRVAHPKRKGAAASQQVELDSGLAARWSASH